MLMRGMRIEDAIEAGRRTLERLLTEHFPLERPVFEGLLGGDLGARDRGSIRSGGYVIDTLTASLWCSLRARDFSSGLLEAVNLGGDADTTGAVVGGLLGLRFGRRSIPDAWLQALTRLDDVRSLGERFSDACRSRWAEDQSFFSEA